MIYRQEHPNPQFERENWQNLNGEWEFKYDFSVSGKDRGFNKNDTVFKEKINVPFCPESKLSGIANTDFLNSVWYRKSINISESELSGRAFINFGAVDYHATLYVNETWVGEHKGGYSSFKFDITDYLKVGENTVVVNATDNTRSRMVPSGKQSDWYQSHGCHYTRTTGIWQTVWLEFVPESYIENVKYVTDADNAVLIITAELKGEGEFSAEAFYDGKSVGKSSLTSKGGCAVLSVELLEKHLWEVGEGRLYDLVLKYGDDTVKSYFGLRSVSISGNKVLINGKSVFQRLVLDQGFYPDGIYTAPSDEALEGDIKLSLQMGFNGARLHQKVFEQRFLYHCDRFGYIVWGEFPSWGLDDTVGQTIYGILPEWLEVVKRDYNHPSIVTWCPFNETSKPNTCHELIRLTYLATKAADSTRPCVDTSGYIHGEKTDIFDIHDYEQDLAVMASHYEKLSETHELADFYIAFKDRQHYDGKSPLAISEYGGTGWSLDNGWGYGDAPKTEEEFIARLKGITDVMLDNENIYSFCYTQLTDVEQEQNGLYYYDRRPKFAPEVIKAILSRKAAIED